MRTATGDLAGEYLARLDAELAGLPRARREEIVDEIREHIAEADAGDEAELRTVLDRLGHPADIAAEARERFGVAPPPRRGALEVAALVLLLIGGVVVPGLGWLAGVVLLWISDVWALRDKLIGTLVVPGGLGGALLFLFVGTASLGQICSDTGPGSAVECSGGLSPALAIAIFAVLVLAPIASVVYLAVRMKRRSA